MSGFPGPFRRPRAFGFGPLVWAPLLRGPFLVCALVCAVTVGLGGCRKATPDAPPPVATTMPPLEVKADGKWLYTYADDEGRFVTIDDKQKVPPTSRRLVRVIDPSQSPEARVDPSKVYVVDLEELDKKGKVEARVLSREAFETGALSQLPPGESSAFPSATPPAPGEGAPPAQNTPGGAAPVVTLYGTSWCGACKSAREYLRARRIPFADRDIERDQAAARELREKAQRLGVGADRIPVLDVRGRLLIGFDKARLEALLGEAT
ncbi:MAG TPA: glutaredoxin family protein [Polyangia bacterium]